MFQPHPLAKERAGWRGRGAARRTAPPPAKSASLSSDLSLEGPHVPTLPLDQAIAPHHRQGRAGRSQPRFRTEQSFGRWPWSVPGSLDRCVCSDQQIRNSRDKVSADDSSVADQLLGMIVVLSDDLVAAFGHVSRALLPVPVLSPRDIGNGITQVLVLWDGRSQVNAADRERERYAGQSRFQRGAKSRGPLSKMHGGQVLGFGVSQAMTRPD